MSVQVKKIMLNELHEEHEEQTVNTNYLDLIHNLEVQCSVRIGTLDMNIGQLRQIHEGQVLQLNQKTNTPIELILNDKLIALGELMCVEDYFAIRIIEVAS